MATEPTIDYDALQQDAMRSVVRAVLHRIVKSGLPGEHHFYISFLTQAPGVILSKRLKEKYPSEMTIVLQHRFWDLLVTDERFEVKLTFDGIPERLVVPFSAIKVFIDPSVKFGLQFEDAGVERDGRAPRPSLTMDAAFDQVGEARADTSRQTIAKKPRSPRKPRVDKDVTEIGTASRPPSLPAAQPPQPAPAHIADTTASDAAPAESSAKILSLDQFRKK